MPFYPNTDAQSYPTCIQHNLYQYKTKHDYASFAGYVKTYILQTYHETWAIVNCYICN